MAHRDAAGLPVAVEAEKCILGSVLAGHANFDVLLSALVVDDFGREDHRRIFRSMSDLHKQGEAVDRITVSAELMNRGELEAVGGFTYLVSLDDGLPQFPSLDGYCKLVREKAVLRRTIISLESVIEQCQLEMENPAGILQRAETMLGNLAEPVSPVSLLKAQQIVDNAPGGLNGFIDPTMGRSRGVPSPWPQVNDIVHSLRGKQFAILAARPSVGKSVAVCQWAYYGALTGFPTAIFTLEMSREEILARLCCARASINTNKYLTGNLSREERLRFAEAAVAIDRLSLRIDDSSGVTVPAIHSAVRRYNATNEKLRLVVVDYIGLMETTGRKENRIIEISEITRGLKKMARELDVAVLAACQLNRASVGERPQLHHLADADAGGRDTDIVMFLHRTNEDFYSKGPIETEFIVEKQRNGPTGTAKLELEGQYVRFHDPVEGPRETPASQLDL